MPCGLGRVRSSPKEMALEVSNSGVIGEDHVPYGAMVRRDPKKGTSEVKEGIAEGCVVRRGGGTDDPRTIVDQRTKSVEASTEHSIARANRRRRGRQANRDDQIDGRRLTTTTTTKKILTPPHNHGRSQIHIVLPHPPPVALGIRRVRHESSALG